VQSTGTSGKITGVQSMTALGWFGANFTGANAGSQTAAPALVTINTTTALVIDVQFTWSVASASGSIQLLGGTIYLD
jgi:hypothetical protein